ncbi:MAG: ABC transporter permease [Actinobacteria bacterium]|nr:ABC transporter permease [Actinomycetota bacterium]
MPETRAGKRPQWLEDLGAQAAALLVALAIALGAGAVIIVGYGVSPLVVYRAVLHFSFGSPDDFGRMLVIATPLIFSALAVAVCFKGGMFNIGVEGQFLVGMATASVAALHFGFLPAPLHLASVLLFGMLGGMAWAAIPAILKVKTGAHEVVTTIMLNGVAVSLVAWALNGPIKYTHAPPGFSIDLRTDYFPQSALVPLLNKPLGMNPSVHVSMLLPLGIVAAAIVWFLLQRMRLGYEARAVGSSAGSAQAGGISIGAVQLKLFLISGALAGLVGMQQILADRNYFPQNYVAQLGFTGIAVAFLGQNNPFGIVAAAILWAVLSRGEDAIQIQTNAPREIIIILQGILILSVVVSYQVAKRRIARARLRAAGAEGLLEDSGADVAEEVA